MSWEKKTIGELCQIEKGKIGIQKAIPGEFPLVVTAEERLSHNEYHFEGNAVVIPLVSSTGHGHRSLKRIHFQSGKFAAGNILCVVIPNDENVLRADYLYRFLDLNKEKELVGRMRGMANVTLPIKEIAMIEIPVPPIDAQIDFVEQYSILEEKSNDLSGELTHQLNLVKQLRQAFLREAMQGKLVPQDPNDELASVLLEKIKAEKERLVKEKKIKKQNPLPPIKEEEIPFEIPENWVWCRLGEIIYDTEGGKSPDCKNVPASRKEWGVIKTTAIQEMVFLESENKVLPDKFFVNPKHIIEEGDVLITRAGPKNRVGIVCCVENLTQNLILSDKTIRILHNKDLVNSKFMAFSLNSPQIKPIIERKMTGMADSQVNITQDNMKGFILPIPPLSEQLKIVVKLDELMNYCDELETSIKESQQRNEMLLQQVLREALEPKEKEVENELN